MLSSAPIASAGANGQLHAPPPLPSYPPHASYGTTLPSRPIPRPRLQPVSLDNFTSPVNENGSFEFDRVIRSGYVQRRSLKTKTWRSIYLVLRPNALSIYKTDKEDKLRHKLFMSELTAVTFLRDPKQKRQHMFGLFSPAHNYYFQANSAKDAQDWVSAIRHEARIEEEEDEMFLASPVARLSSSYAFSNLFHHSDGHVLSAAHSAAVPEHDRFASSSPEPHMLPPQVRRLSSQQQHQHQQQQQHPMYHSDTAAYSGNELGLSDYSDCDVPNHHPTRAGVSSDSLAGPAALASASTAAAAAARPSGSGVGGSHGRSTSQVSDLGFRPASGGLLPGAVHANNSSSAAAAAAATSTLETDPDRVVWQGWLWLLRGKGGVRQWRDSWAVLRPRNLILYKDESEYAAQLILPLVSIVNVVERDPLSRTKKHCLQIITEEKNYRFAAHDEETLVHCLGAFKSLLAKRRALELRAAAAAAATAASPASASPATAAATSRPSADAAVPAALPTTSSDRVLPATVSTGGVPRPSVSTLSVPSVVTIST